MFIGADYDECVDDNGGCGQICVNQVAASPQCLCFEGFTLESNGRNCTGMCVCMCELFCHVLGRNGVGHTPCAKCVSTSEAESSRA